MKKINKERRGILQTNFMQIIAEHPSGISLDDTADILEKRVDLTEYEKSSNASGYKRWKTFIAFGVITLVKSGWVEKRNKLMFITEQGKKVLQLDPVTFRNELRSQYLKWKETQVNDDDPEDSLKETALVKIFNGKDHLLKRKPPEPKSSPISTLIADYLGKRLLLPEIQRSYVWKPIKVRNLIDSIYRGYPAGSILIWQPSDLFQTRDISLSGLKDNTYGSQCLLLDGQQRLTALATIIEGVPIRVREGGKIKEKLVNIYFNLDYKEIIPAAEIEEQEMNDEVEESGVEEIEDEDDLSKMCFHIESRKISSNPHWIPVTKLFKEGIVSVLKYAGIDMSHPNYEFYLNRLNTLYNRKDNYYFPVQELKDYDYEEVTEVFIRVNSSASRLKGSDLALAQVTSRWKGAIKNFEEFIDEFSQGGFPIEEGFLIRCIVAAVTGQCKFKTISKISIKDLQTGFEKVKDGLNYTKNFLKQNAKIDTLLLVPSNYLLIPIMMYAIKKDLKLSDEETRKLLYWFYCAAIWGRYSGSSETTLDQDLAALGLESPIDTFIENIKKATGRLGLTVEDVKEKGVRSLGIFMMSYVVARHRQAKDWGTGLLVNMQNIGKKFKTEFDHVFPQSKLDAYLRLKYEDEGYREKIINETANLVFLSKRENYPTKTNKLPNEYLLGVIQRHGEEALKNQCVPTDQRLWELERYEDFLKERRKLLVEAMNALLSEVLSGKGGPKKLTASELIKRGEGEKVEFKSSLRWDYRLNSKNTQLEFVIAKTITSFMNSEGGTLYIGVDDEGRVLGLANDLSTLKRQNLDAFSLQLTQIINDYLGKEFRMYIHETYEVVDGKEICFVDIEKVRTPVYITNQGKKEFFIRSGNSSQPLDVREAIEYIKNHFID